MTLPLITLSCGILPVYTIYILYQGRFIDSTRTEKRHYFGYFHHPYLLETLTRLCLVHSTTINP